VNPWSVDDDAVDGGSDLDLGTFAGENLLDISRRRQHSTSGRSGRSQIDR
jgi:hypothetical protein